MEEKVIDVVLPVHRPGSELKQLIRRLEEQIQRIRYIYIMHTRDGLDLSALLAEEGYDNIIIEEVKPEEFDHGGTRDRAVRMSDADYILCMTQDAVPADRHLTERLLEAMEDEKTALAYARQIPRADCHVIERYTRSFNYPETGMVKTKEDLATLGIKAYFCSNVCAMYRRQLYLERGGFEKKVIISEDTVYAAGCILAGYQVAYAAEARVIHSHNYSNRQQFHRNFDIAVAQAQHPELFEGIRSETEGIRMMKKTAAYLLRRRHPLMLITLFTSSASKYLGFFMGKHYRRLPKSVVMRCTMNPGYWQSL